MYKHNRIKKTTITVNKGYEGERLEEKINRIVNNKEPITDGAPVVYTDRSDGVRPEYNIRTDRFELAVDAMDKVTQSHLAKRDENRSKFAKKLDQDNKDLNKGGTPGSGSDTNVNV